MARQPMPPQESFWAGGRTMLAFAAGACCITALALAFALGRHWPKQIREVEAPQVRSLDKVRQQAPLPFVELKIDRGTARDAPAEAK